MIPRDAADWSHAQFGTHRLCSVADAAVKSVDELLQQVEFFVDALSDYQCDLALFPNFQRAAYGSRAAPALP